MLKRICKSVLYRTCSLFPACRRARANPRLRSGIHDLKLPLPPDGPAGWKSYPQFRGRAGNVTTLSCHTSALARGTCPHPPHAHDEEEILVLLRGSLDIHAPSREAGHASDTLRLESGQFAYYPAGFAHTIESVGEVPANYLMLKWSGKRAPPAKTLPFGQHRIPVPQKRRRSRKGFHGERVLDGATRHLDRLRCHATTLEPGGGYAPHSDNHDVVILMLAGEGETLGRRFRPHDVVFYAAGEPHGMHNPGNVDAHYVVFEFHGGYRPSLLSRVSRRLGLRR